LEYASFSKNTPTLDLKIPNIFIKTLCNKTIDGIILIGIRANSTKLVFGAQKTQKNNKFGN